MVAKIKEWPKIQSVYFKDIFELFNVHVYLLYITYTLYIMNLLLFFHRVVHMYIRVLFSISPLLIQNNLPIIDVAFRSYRNIADVFSGHLLARLEKRAFNSPMGKNKWRQYHQK